MLDPGPSPPPILWKYKKWDDERLDDKYAWNMVVHGELHYATKDQLNDPLDLHWRERYPSDPIEQFKFAKAFLQANDLVHPDTLKHFQSICNIIRGQQLYNAEAEDGIIGTRIAIEHGVLCLTEVPDNFLMWSHYAAGHSGICVGIRTASIPGLLRKCVYEDVPAFIDAWDFVHGRREFFVRASRTKAKKWEYEQEWRQVGTPGPRPFPDCVDSLIFGVNVDDTTRTKALEAVAESGNAIKLFQATKHRTQYKLLIEPFTL